MTEIAAGGATRWQVALNPPIYLVSVLPGVGVWLLAQGDLVHPLGLLLATFAVVLLQHAINLYNDAADWRLGADVEKADSWVRVHDLLPSRAVQHGTISLLSGGVLGLGVLWQQDQLWLIGIALPMVGLGYLYNAGDKPLSYTHFGEWVTGLCYGPGVFGCLWLVAGLQVNLSIVAGSMAFAALAVALLLSHQPPQIETDRQAGKLSFAVRYGEAATIRTARVLFAIFLLVMLLAESSAGRSWAWWWHALLAVGLFVYVGPARINPKRILLSASTFVLVGILLVFLA